MTASDDDALLAELADLLAEDPPPEVLHAARESLTWRTVDAELAALEYDSLLDGAAAGVRSGATGRTVTFAGGGLTVELEVEGTPGGRRAVGQVVPAGGAELELLAEGSVLATTLADDLGRFVLPLTTAPRLVRIRVRRAGGPDVTCAAIVL